MSTHTHRKAAIDEVFEYVESHDKRLHRLDVVGALPSIPPATVDSCLIKLVANGRLERPARGYVQRKAPKAEPPLATEAPAGLPRWTDKAAPLGARIRAYLANSGPTARAEIERAMGDPNAKRAIDELVRAGDLHFTGTGIAVVALGNGAPQGPAPDSARRWNGEKPAAWSTNPAARDQLPPPSNAGRTRVLPLVLQDLKDRSAKGAEKYGQPLMTENGRDALLDAYQEALDLVMYLRQALEERGGMPA